MQTLWSRRRAHRFASTISAERASDHDVYSAGETDTDAEGPPDFMVGVGAPSGSQ